MTNTIQVNVMTGETTDLRTDAEKADALGAEMRLRRNQILTSSDWTQLADSPRDKQAWAAYRTALRDVPDQPGFPHTILWPTQPEGN